MNVTSVRQQIRDGTNGLRESARRNSLVKGWRVKSWLWYDMIGTATTDVVLVELKGATLREILAGYAFAGSVLRRIKHTER